MGLKTVERFKTALLLFLVLLSLALTFSIWTYKPSFPTIDKTPLLDVKIADTRSLEAIIQPQRVLLSSAKGALSGSLYSADTERLTKQMASWTVNDLHAIAKQSPRAALDNYATAPNRVTLDFEGEVPFRSFEGNLRFLSKELPEASFSRIVLDRNTLEKEESTLYFLSFESGEVYRALLEPFDVKPLLAELDRMDEAFVPFAALRHPGKRSLFVPEAPLSIIGSTYYLEETEPAKFRNALFSDPRLVQHSEGPQTTEEYTDGAALLNVDTLRKQISYFHPWPEPTKLLSPAELLQNAHGFLNEHAGWTDEYRFSSASRTSQKVAFQLYLRGMPVFSPDSATEIVTSWSGSRLLRYSRPYYTLNISLPSEIRHYELPTGPAVYRQLTASGAIEPSEIDQLLIAFEMERDNDKHLLRLEPVWYVQTAGKWRSAQRVVERGASHGLE